MIDEKDVTSMISLDGAVSEIKAFLLAATESKCFPPVQLAQVIPAPTRRFIPAAKAGSDCFSDAHGMTQGRTYSVLV